MQPLNAFLPPHNPEEGETKTRLRFAWEILHKASGYTAVILGACTIILGTFLLPLVNDQKTFRVMYAILLASLLGMTAYLVLNAKKSEERKTPLPQNEQDA